MRTTKTLLLLFGLSISISSFSQLLLGAEVDLPMSHSADISKTRGLGGSMRYDIPFQNKLSLTGAVAYLSFYDRFVDGFPTSNKLILISGGAKYYFADLGKGLYATGEVGLVSVHYSQMTDDRFGFFPGIGYRTNRLDFSGRYNVISNANYLSLGLAYVFRIK